jgi:hypothetical protein
MQRIGQEIGALVAPPCLTEHIAYKSGTQNPDCVVVAHTGNGSGAIVDSAVPSCVDSGGDAPCWQLVPAPTCGGRNIQVSPDLAKPVPASLSYSYQCAVCVPGAPDAARGCP